MGAGALRRQIIQSGAGKISRGIHSGHPGPSPLRGGFTVQIGSPIAMDGGSAGNTGAFSGLPICRTGALIRVSLRQTQKSPLSGAFLCLAEREGHSLRTLSATTASN